VQKKVGGWIFSSFVNSDACIRILFISDYKEWWIGMTKHLETFGL
jgi:hypothetical protein